VRAASAATQFESLGHSLSRHRAITRVSLAAISFTILIALSHQAPAQAGPEVAPLAPEPLLPASVGIAVATDAAISIPFDEAMDPKSVEAGLQVLPAQDFELRWNRAMTVLSLVPTNLWRTDERYLVVVPGTARTAGGDLVARAERYTFTTQTAPAVTDFEVHLAASGPDAPEPSALAAETGTDDGTMSVEAASTATKVSSSSSITIRFSEQMDKADVQSRFAIAPKVEGALVWQGSDLVFTPSDRLKAGMRYSITLVGAHDVRGNVLGSANSFSFVVQDGGQLVKTTPEREADGVEAGSVGMWFSVPMSVDRTNAAFALIDSTTGQPVGGHLVWNEASTQITFTPDVPLPGGRTYRVVIDKSARDAFGNAVHAEWSFTTRAAPVAAAPTVRSSTTTRTAPAIPPAGPATTLAGYALNQVNAARQAYGFAPLVLDPAISAVAASHAADQANNGYFSHVGRDGSTRETRLARGGVGFGWSGENQCYHMGLSQQATLNWCHAQFMAEPYPGYWNHIGNILNPNARRMGVGIATVGGKTVITWDFAD
jgi:uncharacterized protein YkwD